MNQHSFAVFSTKIKIDKIKYLVGVAPWRALSSGYKRWAFPRGLYCTAAAQSSAAIDEMILKFWAWSRKKRARAARKLEAGA